jgi:monoamine oxidase
MRNEALWQSMQLARRANLVDTGQAPPRAGDEGESRRSVLKALAGLGAAAISRPAIARSSGRVAIIGGGIAGLTALHYLTQVGVDARLYEARKRLGGRIHTVETDGVTFERGGQLVNTDHADMHALVRRFGVSLFDRKAEPHRTIIVAEGRALSSVELAHHLRGIAAQIDADAAVLDHDFARYAPQFDRLSMADYLDRHTELMPAPWVRHLLEASARTEYGVEPSQASAIELLFNLPVVDGERVEVLGGSDERFMMDGGSSTLIAAMGEAYRDRIALGRRPIRIERGRAGRLKLTFMDLSVEEADRVIVAVPAPLMSYIEYALPLPALWRALIAELRLGRCEKWQWAMRDTPWRTTMGRGGEGWSGDRNAGAALVWEGTVRRATEVPVWNWFQGGAQVTGPGEMIDGASLARSFAPIAPGLDQLRAGASNRTSWHLDPLAKGAYVNFAPGQLSRFAPLLSVDGADRQYSRVGPIVFAGEHLSDAYPGYMNGAAQTGRMAAEAILGERIAVAAA